MINSLVGKKRGTISNHKLRKSLKPKERVKSQTRRARKILFSARFIKTKSSRRWQGLAIMAVAFFMVNTIFIVSPTQERNTMVNMSRETDTSDNYVDNNASDVDSNPDKGTHSNFENQKLKDGVYDTIQEENITARGSDITYDTHTSHTSSGSTSSWSHTVGSGNNRLLVVGATWEHSKFNPPSCTNVTYNGVQLTELVDEYIASSSRSERVTLWYMVNPPSGNYIIEVTASSNPDRDIIAFATSYFGVYQGPPDDYDHYSATSGTISVTLTALAENSTAVFVCGCSSEGTWTAMDSNSTIIKQYSQDGESGCFGESDNIPSGNRSVGAFHDDINRAIIAAACWRPASVEGTNYEINLEIQWTSVNTSKSNYNLAIYCGSFNTSEDIEVWIRFGDPTPIWLRIASALNENSWNNLTITPFINTTITIRFLGGNEINDPVLSAWDIDAAIIHGWTPDIPTVLTVDKTTITMEPGETAVFNITYTDDSQGTGITGANLTYLWDYGSGQLEEVGDGNYRLTISTYSIDDGTYYIDISASLKDYQSQSFQLSLVIVSSKADFMDQIRDFLPHIFLLILGAFGSIVATQRYSVRKQELHDKEKIRRILVVRESFALYDQTPSEFIVEGDFIDKDLVSGFFSAIRDITKEITGTTLETMKVYPSHPYYFVDTDMFYCVLILSDKPSRRLEEKLVCFAEIVEEKYGNIYSSSNMDFLEIKFDLDKEVMRIFGITPTAVLQDIVTVSLSFHAIKQARVSDNVKTVLMAGNALTDRLGRFPLEDLIRSASEVLGDMRIAHSAVLEALELGFITVLVKKPIPEETQIEKEIKPEQEIVEKVEEEKEEETSKNDKNG